MLSAPPKYFVCIREIDCSELTEVRQDKECTEEKNAVDRLLILGADIAFRLLAFARTFAYVLRLLVCLTLPLGLSGASFEAPARRIDKNPL